MKKISLFIVATNKYITYINSLLESCDKYFLVDSEVNYNIFTNSIEDVENIILSNNTKRKVNIFEIEHKPFPYPTLYRYHFIKKYKDGLNGYDYYFYIDVDSLITDNICENDVLSDIVGTQHCGFVKSRGTYENNPLSTSFVKNDEGEIYFGGGFWGFNNLEFWKFIDKAVKMIDEDNDKNIIPIWHDESVLNRYLIDNKPTKILTPSYHYPQNNPHIHNMWNRCDLVFPCKILLLDKNHKEIRS
jgi:histo-blood group ABO system transferase